jgi:tetratricopeptide (TPR) repeat protein
MQGAVLNNIGLVYLDKGATQKAIETLEQALILNQKTSQLKAMADTLGNMGLVYLSQNDVDKAIDYLNQSLKLSAGFKNEGRSFQNDLMNLGAAYFKQGLIRVAFAYYLAARHFYRKNGDLVGEKESLIELARCALEDMETFEQNREMLVQIQLMLFKTGLAAKLETDELLGPKTKMALKQIDSEEELFKDKSDPLIYYENALEITRQMLDDRSEYTILTDLSSAYRRMKNIDKAISCCKDAMKKAQDLVDIKAEISCLITLLQLYSSDEAYDPDKVAGYKEKAKILLRKRGILKADNLYVWIMDYHKTPSMALLKDANYKLCLSIGTPPENFLTAGKQTAFPTAKIELIYNLIEENPLSFEPKVRGKMTETEVTEKLQPIIKGLQKLEPGELSEHQPPAYTEDADTIVTAVPLIEEKPSDKEVLGQPYEVSKVATPVEIEVNVEGIGIDCERSKDILTGSEFLDFPIIPKEIGEQRLVIKCKANEIRFDTMLAVKVEKGQTRFTRLLRSKPIENLSVENVKAMLREQDFYDKFYNPKGKGIRHEYELIERQGKKLVIDHATGLMWQQSGSKIRMSYNNALEYIGTLNINHFAGYNDWRLPTLEEAMSLVVVEPKMVADLYIDFLFDSHQRWIWTADKESSEWLWVVSFSHSRCNRSRFGSDARYVRGVR